MPTSATYVPLETFSAKPRTREVAGFRFFDGRFAAGGSIPPHYHEGASALVVVEGALIERFGSATHECSSATLLAKPAGEPHRDRFSDAGARAVAVEPDPARGRELAALVPAGIVHLRDRRIEALAWQIAAELREPDGFTALALEGLALELFARVARAGRGAGTPEPAPPWLGRVRDMLETSLGEPVRLADLAAAAGRHPAYVARVFRRHHGCSVGAYARRLRLEWAAVRLTTTTLPISVVALQAGFADQSHFTRAFRRHTRTTPADYRQRARHPT